MSLSALILTHNESEMLSSCLSSLSWVDEIVVVDKYSTDATCTIAEQFHAKVIQFKGESFDEWRNLALYHASSDWVLYIDPDERITAPLKNSIIEVTAKESPSFGAYRFPRKNIWWGREFSHCGAWPDYVTRLFVRDQLKTWKGYIHESPVFAGNLGTIDYPLMHFTHRNLNDGLKKSMQWTAMEAQLFFQANHPDVTWWRLAKVTLAAFWKKYIQQGGYKEGTEGFLESGVQAFNRFMVYAHLWQMQHSQQIKKAYSSTKQELG